jgi:hypothetical protein
MKRVTNDNIAAAMIIALNINAINIHQLTFHLHEIENF